MESRRLNANVQDVALRRLGLLTAQPDYPEASRRARLVFLAELASLGYLVTNPVAYNDSLLSEYTTVVVPTLTAQRGGDVSYAPLFDEFPDRIPTDDLEVELAVKGLLETAFPAAPGASSPVSVHDVGWWPVSSVRQNPRLARAAKARQETLGDDSHTEWIDLTIKPADEVDRDIKNWLADLLYSPTSIKEDEHADILALLTHYGFDWISYDRVGFRETRSLLLHTMWVANVHDEILRARPTPTDLLRMFASVTETDPSLAEPIKFPKMNKSQRRLVLACLEATATTEEMMPYRSLWLRLGEYIHPGSYRKRYPKAFACFAFLRANRRDATSFNSVTERLDAAEQDVPLLRHLQSRPTIFARRLRQLLVARDRAGQHQVLEAFAKVSHLVPAKVLITLRVHINTVETHSTRAVVNKAGKVHVVTAPPKLANQVRRQALSHLDDAIAGALGKQPTWEGRRVWIDPALARYVAPFQQRKITDGLLNVARGTRLPLDMNKVLRLFVYWHESGRNVSDLDLSAVTLGRDMSYVGHVDYTRLRGTGIVHSGDLTSAPVGAAEFIDITLDRLPNEARYVVPQIHRFSGPAFGALPRAHAGWMVRTDVDADHKSFDIKTVQNVFDLKGGASYSIPFIADLQAEEIIYTDLFVGKHQMFNTVTRHLSNISDITREVARFHETRPTLHGLVSLNAAARGAVIVEKRSSADMTFGVDSDCDYQATDVARLNAELLPEA